MPQNPTPIQRVLVTVMAEDLVKTAKKFGLVVTITQQPLQPLAMRNYQTVIEIRDGIVRDNE